MAQTTYTYAQLAALEKALASGSRRYQLGEIMVEYRTVDELIKAIEQVKAGLAQQEADAASKRRTRQVRVHTSSGF